ncbi:FixH family protein [Brevundimonas sp. AJA228-03]|uniref:FixH family protein n=1 Tax=Brevundimonas sp. AJA228-03 TaxID=2752515 RepID=UPI001AE09CCE|nr:FixH family protein [Brevundimonas sp. AJA228-03]QTN20509.1 FixH family protein [Brevundimonas sp. AJA228-03]
MMIPAALSRPPFTIKGWHVAAGVVAFFAVVVTVDMSFLVIAYRTHPGQVEAKPYETGLIYNAELERLRVQDALGWRAGARATPAGLEVLLEDRDGAPLADLTASALLQRPATEQGRAQVRLTQIEPGRYQAALALTGVWDVRIDATDGTGRRIVAERRLTWP